MDQTMPVERRKFELQRLRTERWTWRKRINWMLVGAAVMASANFVARWLA